MLIDTYLFFLLNKSTITIHLLLFIYSLINCIAYNLWPYYNTGIG